MACAPQDPKYIDETHPDFEERRDVDFWPVQDAKGRWVTREGTRPHRRMYGAWYAWLRRYTRGALSEADIPVGSIASWATPREVQRIVKRKVRSACSAELL